MRTRVHRLTAERHLEPSSVDEACAQRSTGSAYWLDVADHDAESLGALLYSFEVHPLAIEACIDPLPTSGLVAYGNSLFMGFPTHPSWDAEEAAPMRIVCLPGVIITVHDVEVPALEKLVRHYRSGLRLQASDTSALVYQILDHIIDDDMAFTLRTRAAIDRVEELLDEESIDEFMEQALPLKQQVARLSADFEDQLYCVGSLQAIDSEAFSIGGLRDYFRDAVSHLEHASRAIGRQAAHLNSIQQQYQLKLQDRTNDRLRLLTVISTIFMPLTLIAGIYGMNFRHMPELAWRYSYPVVLLAMLGIAVGMLWGFYRTGWFK